MQSVAKRVECRLATAVKMHRVFLEAVVGRQVHPATEPEHLLAAGPRSSQHAHIHVHRGHVRVSRMKDQRNADGLEGCPGQFRTVLRRRRWQPGSAHVRKTTAGALKNRPSLKDAGDTLALKSLARRLFPCIVQKAGAIDRRYGAGDA